MLNLNPIHYITYAFLLIIIILFIIIFRIVINLYNCFTNLKMVGPVFVIKV